MKTPVVAGFFRAGEDDDQICPRGPHVAVKSIAVRWYYVTVGPHIACGSATGSEHVTTTMLQFRPGSVPMRQPKTLVSILILLAIGLHAAPLLLHRGHREILWPFLVWAMYKDSRPPGPIQMWKARVIGVTANGESEQVTAPLLGVSGFALGRMYIQPMARGDSSAARQLISRLNRERQDPIVELRYYRETYTATDAGIVRKDDPTITYRVHPSASR